MSLIKKICLFYLTIIRFSYAQTPTIDSLIRLSNTINTDTTRVKLYGDISWELMAVNISKALYYAEKQLALAKQIHNTPLIAQAESDLGNVLNRKSDYPNALIHYYYALELRQKLKQPVKEAGIYSNIATVLMRQNKFQEAIVINFKSLKLFEEINDKNKQSLILGNIGNIYYELDQNKQALIYQRKALLLAQESNNPSSEANILINIGGVHHSEKNLDSALYYYKVCEKILLKNNLLYALGSVYNDIGKAYSDKKEYAKAVSYFDKSLANRIEFQDEYGIGLSNVFIGELSIKLKKYNEAISHLEKAIQIFNKTHSLLNLKDCYKYMAQAHELNGDLSSSIEDYKLFSAYKDSVFTTNASSQLVEMNTKYETDKKAQENKLLTTQNKLSEETINRQRIFSYFIITALLLLAGLAFFIFRGLKFQRKANSIISKQKQVVESKNHIIEEKQKEIVDSINYAKRIQVALLANHEFVNQFLPNNFILFKPKDIVSGDFYWATEHNNKFYIAVCDCTGHGVPGAFMSLLNIGFLSEAIKEKNIEQPHEIFNYVRTRLISTISKEGQQDGMDGIILCLDKETNQYTYAAANNEPILVSNKELKILAKDKMPVGKGEKNDSFSLYSIDAKAGDTIYLYTDGFADQFGGPKGKKFKYKPLNELLLSSVDEPMETQKKLLDTTIESWKGNLEQVDDVLVIGIKI
jgi:serine phosphatase RsbU (regulator of sigma subunit)